MSLEVQYQADGPCRDLRPGPSPLRWVEVTELMIYHWPLDGQGIRFAQIVTDMPKELASTKAARPTPFPDRKTAGSSLKVEPRTDKFSLRWEHPPSLPVLLTWFADMGIWVSDKFTIQPMEEGQGWGVVATEVGIPLEVGSFFHFEAMDDQLRADSL